jgi:hypothetical protein
LRYAELACTAVASVAIVPGLVCHKPSVPIPAAQPATSRKVNKDLIFIRHLLSESIYGEDANPTPSQRARRNFPEKIRSCTTPTTIFLNHRRFLAFEAAPTHPLKAKSVTERAQGEEPFCTIFRTVGDSPEGRKRRYQGWRPHLPPPRAILLTEKHSKARLHLPES